VDIWIVSLIILATLYLLISEKIPIDVTALGVMAGLTTLGVLSPQEAVQGFANPAVITVGAMFLVSIGLIRTGAVGFIAEHVIRLSRGNATLALAISLVVVGGASAFINNTPVVVLFIPIVLELGCEYQLSPSKFLIPVSYASILAGTCTLIGTSTNIIVSDLSDAYGYGPLSMFELAPLGLPIAILGMVFLFFVSHRFMPSHAVPTCELEEREDRRYLAELLIGEGSRVIGEEPDRAFSERYPGLEVFEVIRGGRILYPERDKIQFASGDLVFVKASANDLVSILHEKVAQLPHVTKDATEPGRMSEPILIELIVPPQSSLLGERLTETDLLQDPDIHVIGVKRRRLLYSKQKIRSLELRVGDILLVRLPQKKLDRIRQGPDFIIIEEVHHRIVLKKKAPLALAIFMALITAATAGLADIMVCAIAAAFLMMVTGCVPLREAYRSLQPNVLLLIIGTIALGAAMEKTGTSRLYAKAFLALFQGLPFIYVMAGVLFLTSFATHLLSNNATAVLLLPVAISTALVLGVNPKPFIMAVCLGANTCYATPIGYQTNLLVYGPGGYRFGDYLKLGIPMNLIVLLMGLWMIPMLWPL
jgi:di/tricarboxylate transporter